MALIIPTGIIIRPRSIENKPIMGPNNIPRIEFSTNISNPPKNVFIDSTIFPSSLTNGTSLGYPALLLHDSCQVKFKEYISTKIEVFKEYIIKKGTGITLMSNFRYGHKDGLR